MAPRFEAIIFDLDGTLADTLQDIALSMNAALAALGQPQHQEPHYRTLVGEGVTTLARRALPADREDLVPAALAHFRAHYAAHLLDHTRPYPEIPSLLDALAQRGLPQAILSNKLDPMTQDIVSGCLGRWRFHPVFGERPGVPRKPDPTAALEIAMALGTKPARTLLVGDSAVDMATSVNAGMFGVGVDWGFRGREELQAAGARQILSSPLQLLQLLQAPSPQ
jgi:phosphoglycolate phosphatase